MAEKLPKQSVNINPEIERIRDEGRYRLIGALTGFALVATLTQSETFNRYAESGADAIADVIASQPVDADLFEEMAVIRVDNPNDNYDAGPTADVETSQQFVNGIEALSRASGGILDVPSDVRVLEVSLAPDSKTQDEDSGAEYACYDKNTLEAATEEAFRQNNLPTDTLAALSFETNQGGVVCGENDAVAYVQHGSLWEAGVYQNASLRHDEYNRLAEDNVNLQNTIVMHELGHTAGLSHSSQTEMPIGAPRDSYDTIDTMIQHGLRLAVKKDEEYGVIRDEQGSSELSSYENRHTVMGSLHDAHEAVASYSFIEQNKMNKEAAEIIKINPTEAREVQVSIDGPVRGIVLDIPDDHPIRTIEHGKNLDKVYIGIEHDQMNGYAGYSLINTYFENENRGDTFALFGKVHSPGYIEKDPGEPAEALYVDETLGVTVRAVSSYEDYTNATLIVEPHEK